MVVTFAYCDSRLTGAVGYRKDLVKADTIYK